MSKVTICMTVMVCLIFLTQQNDDSLQSMTIDSTSCEFYYYYSASSPFTFYQCSTPKGVISNWTTCFAECCLDMPSSSYDPSYYALTVCKDFNSGSKFSMLVWILIISSSILGAAIVVIMIVSVWRNCSLSREFRISAEENLIILQVEWREQKQFSKEINNIVWSPHAKKQNKISESNNHCCICLQEELTTAQLFCKHHYHPKCIGSWFQKSSCCPICRLENIRGVKIYCSCCHWRYLVATRTLVAQSADKLPLRCERCEEKRMRKQSLSQLVSADSRVQIKLSENYSMIKESQGFTIEDIQSLTNV